MNYTTLEIFEITDIQDIIYGYKKDIEDYEAIEVKMNKFIVDIQFRLDEQDVIMVQEQSNCPLHIAVSMLIKHRGDIVYAILEIID